ncbi:MAG TPA: RHS repeat-associated core domain-containing protein, partial [Leptospiraceae bacterium]|nr:RHS repeat-associated core domain-containing protein [Leptospiraceae bacterium]HNE11656.1 RHS repeat-associated core domain-containing protein [Leptospiraceae bacterium]HNF56727.1 RHS repeat-associated core domain-containing protein [Leptospiraceae bacterium]HNM92283.1 RHS repeat-associated core domain-containing protein [Leptospiraceae bacterium]
RMNSYGPDIFRYKYTSQQDDQDTGLYYYNARYYDPVLGSFTSADNVTNATSAFGLNHYMYTEGNPVRYGDASGNFLGPLLYAGFQFAVGSAAAIAIGSAAVAVGATIAVGLAVVNMAMTAAAVAQTAAIATATFLATTLVAAVRFALFVNALGTIGAGLGFVAGGIETGTLQGALAGAEIGFKIGTAIQIAVNIAVGSWYFGGFVKTIVEQTFTKLSGSFIASNPYFLTSLSKLLIRSAIMGIYGQIVKGIGREAGGHLNPNSKGFRYDRDSAYRGESAASFVNTASQTFYDISQISKEKSIYWAPESFSSITSGWNNNFMIVLAPLEIAKALLISEGTARMSPDER